MAHEPVTKESLRAYLLEAYDRYADDAHYDRHDGGEDRHFGAMRALVELGRHFGIELECREEES
jgi:hypothetical protein